MRYEIPDLEAGDNDYIACDIADSLSRYVMELGLVLFSVPNSHLLVTNTFDGFYSIAKIQIQMYSESCVRFIWDPKVGEEVDKTPGMESASMQWNEYTCARHESTRVLAFIAKEIMSRYEAKSAEVSGFVDWWKDASIGNEEYKPCFVKTPKDVWIPKTYVWTPAGVSAYDENRKRIELSKV